MILNKAVSLCPFSLYDPDIEIEDVEDTGGNYVFSVVDATNDRRVVCKLPVSVTMFARSADNLGKVVANAWVRNRVSAHD